MLAARPYPLQDFRVLGFSGIRSPPISLILLTARIGAPSVIGELCAGVVLGPSLLGGLEPVEPIRLLAEIGIIPLLFKVSLEADIRKLASSGGPSVTVAVVGFVPAFVLGFLTDLIKGFVTSSARLEVPLETRPKSWNTR